MTLKVTEGHMPQSVHEHLPVSYRTDRGNSCLDYGVFPKMKVDIIL